jgi:hypothetical protein
MNKKKIKLIFFVLLLIFLAIMFFKDNNFQKNLKWDYLKIKNWGNKNWSQIDSVFENFSSQEIQNAKIDIDSFQSGGVAKDDIPSLINPNFDSASSTKFQDNEKIIGVFLNGEARAYPYSILYWHEIINDTIAGEPITVTLCPLCNTTSVFARTINGKRTSFGVSGKLFNSCLIMHDRQTNSLWSQVWGLGVMGEHKNYTLEKIISHTTTLGEWKKLHPKTLVLSTDTGHSRNYNQYPYEDYLSNDKLRFSAQNQAKLKLAAKDTIYYFAINNLEQNRQNTFEGESWSIPKNKIKEKKEISFTLKKQNYNLKWDNTLNTARLYNSNNKELPIQTAFAFVYPAYFNK